MGLALVHSDDKACPRCRQIKPVSEFTIRESGARAGQAVAHCKACCVERNKTAKLRDKTIYRRIEWPSKLRRQYGIEPADYYAMLAAQNGGCKICGIRRPGGGKHRGDELTAFHVDHDHATGRVRGLLCMKCNKALGLIGDSPEIAAKIIVYLKEGGS